jgi:hypothetical protein
LLTRCFFASGFRNLDKEKARLQEKYAAEDAARGRSAASATKPVSAAAAAARAAEAASAREQMIDLCAWRAGGHDDLVRSDAAQCTPRLKSAKTFWTR